MHKKSLKIKKIVTVGSFLIKMWFLLSNMIFCTNFAPKVYNNAELQSNWE